MMGNTQHRCGRRACYFACHWITMGTLYTLGAVLTILAAYTMGDFRGYYWCECVGYNWTSVVTPCSDEYKHLRADACHAPFMMCHIQCGWFDNQYHSDRPVYHQCHHAPVKTVAEVPTACQEEWNNPPSYLHNPCAEAAYDGGSVVGPDTYVWGGRTYMCPSGEDTRAPNVLLMDNTKAGTLLGFGVTFLLLGFIINAVLVIRWCIRKRPLFRITKKNGKMGLEIGKDYVRLDEEDVGGHENHNWDGDAISVDEAEDDAGAIALLRFSKVEERAAQIMASSSSSGAKTSSQLQAGRGGMTTGPEVQVPRLAPPTVPQDTVLHVPITNNPEDTVLHVPITNNPEDKNTFEDDQL
jgi:hypothetical protein